MSMSVFRLFPSLLRVGWGTSCSFTYTSPGQKSNPCSDSPLKSTTSPALIPFQSQNLRSRGAIIIFYPLQTGHFDLAPKPDPPHSLHFIYIFFTVSFTFTYLIIFPVPPHTEHLCFYPLRSPVPLQFLQISPRLKLQTISPPLQNFQSGTHIYVLKSPPFLKGVFQSYLRPASPCKSQVILFETSIKVQYARLISTYFFWIQSFPALRSGWYLTDSLLNAFLISSLVAFSSTYSN